MPVSFYEVVWIFLIYAFFGWCTEVAYAALDTGKFVNRGFLNGPVCPIYGCGVLLVVVVLTPLKENLFILFVGSVILTTAIEFITGFLLEKIFHNQWWDYSNQPFNVCGYICLKFSILWGLACTFVMKLVHPAIYKMIQFVPHIPGLIIMIILLVAFACDMGITVASILKFNKRLRLMHEIADKLKVISNEIGENIYENVTEAVEKKEELQEKLEDSKENIQDRIETSKENIQDKIEVSKESIRDNIQKKKEEYQELRKKYEELLSARTLGNKRLIKAFPGMKSKIHQESLNKLKQRINDKKVKRCEKK